MRLLYIYDYRCYFLNLGLTSAFTVAPLAARKVERLVRLHFHESRNQRKQSKVGLDDTDADMGGKDPGWAGHARSH